MSRAKKPVVKTNATRNLSMSARGFWRSTRIAYFVKPLYFLRAANLQPFDSSACDYTSCPLGLPPRIRPDHAITGLPAMRILLIHSFYQHFGGEDSVVNSEIELLKQHGEKMYLFTRRNEETKDFCITQRALFFPQTIYSWNSGAEIEGVVERFKPDIAFVHNVYPLISPAAYHTLHKLRVPTVQMLHGFRPYCPNGFFYTQGKICEACKFGNYLNAVVRRCYKDSYGLSALYALTLGLNRLAGMVDKISAFICLTPFFKAKMLEVGIPESKLFIRPNFICPPPPLPHVPGGNKYVLFAGRLVPEKGCWTLLRAFEQLVDVPLKIMGTGPIEQELRI